jgi:hypothetical protein
VQYIAGITSVRETKMSSKDIVLRTYPKAAVQLLKAIPDTPGIQGIAHWRVHTGAEQLAATLGTGQTEDEAWQSAAIHSSQRRPE